jgi:predicted nucleic acid-binding protein
VAVLIDSSVFIAAERRGLRPTDLKRTLRDEPAALAAVTASELLVGVYRADTPVRRARREVFVESVLDAFPVLPFDLPIARHHARVRSDLLSTGRSIGDHDLIIAATAVAHGYDILTDTPRNQSMTGGEGVIVTDLFIKEAS